MKKSKTLKTLDKKPERVKWPLAKFINKFFIYNVFLTIGIAMLILSFACQSAFNGDQGKIIGNIVVSALVTFAGLAGGLVYSLLLTKRGEEPLEQRFANLTKWFFWVPILGIVFNKIWKSKEKKLNLALKLQENPNFKKPKMVLPSSISLIFAAMIGIVFLIWVLYLAGLVTPNAEKGEFMPGIIDIFLNPIRGFAGYTSSRIIGYRIDDPTKPIYETINGTASIVIFLLLFNGTMTLVNDSHSIEAGIGALLKKMKGKEIILIPVLMLILGICGSTFNMCEQLLPLFMVVIPIMFAAGFDAMTGFLMVNMSAGVGVMSSTVNPVLLGTAVSSIPKDVVLPEGFGLMTGITWRLVMFAVLITTSIICTTIYALRVRKDPNKSVVYMSDAEFKSKYTFDKDALPPMTKKRKWTLIVFGVAFLMLIMGFIDWKQIANFNGFNACSTWLAANFPFLSSITPIGSWGMVEAGMLFFIASMIIGAINWKGAGHFFATFYSGCKDFIGVAFIVSVAKGLSITLSASGLNQVIANGLGGALGKMPAFGAMIIIFAVIAIMTVFIPSSSGLASAMFPVISSSVATAGTITMSGAVTTFAAGMGWTNLFTPTGMVLPFCEYSKVEYGDFIKGSWKQIAILLVVGLALMGAGTFVTSMF